MKVVNHLAVAGVVALASGLAAPAAAAATGPSWAVQSTPNPSGALGSDLAGVSCSSVTACTAVGSYEKSSGAVVTLAERWNGTRWAVQSTPTPSGAQFPDLLGVSCSSATSCTAAGFYSTSGGADVALTERWNGTKWAVQSTPTPSGANTSTLAAVSCSSATACTAVGSYGNNSGFQVALAERWNGTRWAIQSTPTPSGANTSDLAGVSCFSATACTAVGSYGNNSGFQVALAERWNGTKWAIQPTPNPSATQGLDLLGVSCSSATACTAAGDYVNSSGAQVTLAERWNGTKWAIQPTPNPSGAEASYLYGVSCPSATACTAAGLYANSSGVFVTLAEHWNGTKWAVQSTPNPSGAQNSQLFGVSCSSATACTAAGFSVHSSGVEAMLAERYS